MATKRVTSKQRKIAELIIENSIVDKPLNGGQMLEKVGYSKSMQTAKVNDVLESEGVQQALEEYGFSESNAKMVVSEILLDQTKDANARLKAADQVFKVFGSYAAEKSTSVNLNVDLNTDKTDLDTVREEYEAKLKQQLSK